MIEELFYTVLNNNIEKLEVYIYQPIIDKNGVYNVTYDLIFCDNKKTRTLSGLSKIQSLTSAFLILKVDMQKIFKNKNLSLYGSYNDAQNELDSFLVDDIFVGVKLSDE
jgi:hypothetical protein